MNPQNGQNVGQKAIMAAKMPNPKQTKFRGMNPGLAAPVTTLKTVQATTTPQVKGVKTPPKILPLPPKKVTPIKGQRYLA